MDEAAALTPSFAGVSYDRLEGYDSLQWPVDKDGTDSPLLYVEGFPFPDGKARLYPLEFEFNYDTSDKYDLHVNNGSVLEHFHEGNMTYKSPGVKDKLANTVLEVAPDLANERGTNEGAEVKLISDAGEVTCSVHITGRVAGNELYLPANDSGHAAI